MAIKVKKGGVYADPVGIFAKKAGVYSAVTGVSAKVAGAYVSVGGGGALTPPSSFARLSGINGSGGEFTHDAAGLPGTLGTQYVYPSAPLLAYLRSRGHRMVRLPFRWERIQPTLGGPLSPTGIAELKEAVQRCASAGLLVLLDMHNYGRYIRLDDVEVMFGTDGTLSQTHFADAWTKLVNEFAGQPAIAGWG